MQCEGVGDISSSASFIKVWNKSLQLCDYQQKIPTPFEG
jgi:hypothetical protein